MIAIDYSRKQIEYLHHNASIYNLLHKINPILADFLTINIKRSDFVFLNPNYVKRKEEKFSLFKHIEPDIFEIIKKGLEVSNNIMLLLPKYTDISELAMIFASLLEDLNM